MPYRHTQIGWITGGGLAFGTALCAVVTALSPVPWISLAVLILLASCLLLFPTLTAEVTAEVFRFHFGVWLIGRRYPLEEIESCEAVRNRWWYGWGIRLTPHGWLYNVSGLDAVQVRLKNGKTFRVGTDRPAELCEAIQRGIAGHVSLKSPTDLSAEAHAGEEHAEADGS